MERALGKIPEPLSPDRHRIESGLDHDAFEILGKPASAAGYLDGQLRAQKASGAKRGYEIQVLNQTISADAIWGKGAPNIRIQNV